MYSVLAAASGFGVASAANAQIFYSGPQNISVDDTADVAIDLDSDGFDDYTFSIGTFAGQPLVSFLGGTDYVFVYLSGLNYPYAQNFTAGEVLPDAGDTLAYNATVIYANLGAFQSPTDSGFLGGIFGASDGVGGFVGALAWVQIADVTDTSLTVVDWAYTIDDLTLEVGAIPEPASLGALALGALGVVRNRRRKAA
ncbi:MAG: PEP-CTERM sorting domain-containing protein [Planctomycetota bacterium]